jgi:hypothetical protein
MIIANALTAAAASIVDQPAQTIAASGAAASAYHPECQCLGLGAKWSGIAQHWADPNAHHEVFDAFVSLTATEQRHTLGASHPVPRAS